MACSRSCCEAAVKFLDGFLPRQLAFFDFVEFLFHASRETHVEDILETLDQQDAHFFAEHRGRKSALVLGDVLPVDNRGDDRSVGGGASDALFFQLLHQRGVGVARRRLGKMLFGAQGFKTQDFALGDERQQSLVRVRLGIFVVLGSHLVHGQVAIELLHRAGGAKRVIARRDVDRRLVEHRRHHLRSDKPLPDELVQLEQVLAQERFHIRGRARGVGRPDGFVGFLRVLLGLVEIRLLRQVCLAEAWSRSGRGPDRARRSKRAPSRCACR